MPFVAAAAVGAVIANAGAIIAGTATFASVATSFAGSVVLGLASQALQRRQQPASRDAGTQVNVRSALASRRLVYGRCRVDGPIVFAATAGRRNKELYLVVPIAAHQVAEVEEVYFNDTPVWPVRGRAPYDNVDYSISVYTGAAGQPADPSLLTVFPGIWTSAHRLDGVAYIVAAMVWDSNDNGRSPWAALGMPTVSARVKGRLVYDPRNGGTAWSDNAALCLRDYLMHPLGLGCGAAEIDDVLFAAAASVCDETVYTPAGAAQRRYVVAGTLDTAATPLDNVRVLAGTMAGGASYCQGTWRPHPAAWTPPAGDAQLGADQLRGALRVRPQPPRRERVNAVRGTFVAADQSDQAVDFPAVRNPAYESQDGETLWLDLDLPLTTDAFTAQRIARLTLERARQTLTVDWPGTLACLRYVVGDRVTVTLPQLGWAGKTFQVVDWTLGADGQGVDLVLQEDAAPIYTIDPAALITSDLAPDTGLSGPWTMPAPVIVALTSGTEDLLLAGDGTIVSRLRVVADAGDAGYFAAWDVQWRRVGDAVWSSTSTSDMPLWLGPVQDGVMYEVRVRTRNALGVASDWVQRSHVVVGKTQPPPDPSDLRLDGLVASWQPVVAADLAGYLLRYHPGVRDSFEDAIPLHDGVVTTSPFRLQRVPSGTVTLLLAALDTSGNRSLTPARLVIALGDAAVANVLWTYDDAAAGWPGTLAQGARTPGGLRADETTRMWGGDDRAAFWAYASWPMWRTATYLSMGYETSFTPPAVANGTRLVVTVDATGDTWRLDYRRQGPAPMWGSVDTELQWGADSDPLWHVPNWLPWPGEITAPGAEPVDLRMTTGAGVQRGSVSALTVTADVPDVTEHLAGVAIAAGGTRLPIVAAYHAITAVQLTLYGGGGTAFTVRVLDRDAAAGPLVQCLDASGVGTTGVVDALVQGY